MKNSRRTTRLIGLIFFFGAGAFFLAGGFDAGRIADMRFVTAGAFFLFIRMLGACGINVWRGGPLDPRNDPPPEPPGTASPP
jgi:hypothetical protein